MRRNMRWVCQSSLSLLCLGGTENFSSVRFEPLIPRWRTCEAPWRPLLSAERFGRRRFWSAKMLPMAVPDRLGLGIERIAQH